jgi:hypothetical protein
VGVEVSRIEKIRRLSTFEPAQKKLHVCVRDEEHHCMRCGKCVRVLTALDALGTIDRFGEVFDLEYFYEHRDEIWGQAIYEGQHNVHFAESLAVLKQSGRTPGKRAMLRARMLEVANKAAHEHEAQIMRSDGHM